MVSLPGSSKLSWMVGCHHELTFGSPIRFLKDAFDMVGCHHERLLVSLQTACSTLEPATMDEAAIITQLLYQLAGYVG